MQLFCTLPEQGNIIGANSSPRWGHTPHLLFFQLSDRESELGTISTSLKQFLNETGLGSIPDFIY